MAVAHAPTALRHADEAGTVESTTRNRIVNNKSGIVGWLRLIHSLALWLPLMGTSSLIRLGYKKSSLK